MVSPRTSTQVEDLSQRTCKPCEGGVPKLQPDQIQKMLKQVQGWEVTNEQLVKDLKFPDFHQTMAFVNAVAWIAHTQNHHPDLEVGYNHCTLRYSTHAVGGLTDNDFICAAKVDRLLEE